MQKIPTVFVRDWEGDRSRVLPEVNAECAWVVAGEGVATRKLDGTCCMIRAGKLYKRQEFKRGQTAPDDFEEINFDEETGKRIGWRPVGDGPEDKWHREAFADLQGKLVDGTYELVGPKTQGNPERFEMQTLIPHTVEQLGISGDISRTFTGLKAYLAHFDIEGIVFHHPDGRMAKIKKRDFGLKRSDKEYFMNDALDRDNGKV